MPYRLRTLLTNVAGFSMVLRFTIRDLLWVTIVAALAVSWWIDNKRIENTIAKIKGEQAELTAELEDKIAILDKWNDRPGYVGMLERAAKIRAEQKAKNEPSASQHESN